MTDRDSWAQFEGIDVEGRLKGIRTLFIAYGAIPEDAETYPHIWFQPQWLQSHGYEDIYPLTQHSLVTLEVSQKMIYAIPDDLMSVCHIVLAIPMPMDVNRLKPSDTVRFDLAPMRVACTPYNTFMHSYPHEYKDDKPLVERKPR